jgi:hypothetical protein
LNDGAVVVFEGTAAVEKVAEILVAIFHSQFIVA